MSTSEITIVTPRRKLIGLAVVCAVFAVMGAIVLLVNPTATLNLIVGVAALAFFGVGGGWSIATQWRRSTILSADADGIRVRGVGTVAWADVDRVGAKGDLLGIRLRDPAALLETAPPAYTRESLRQTRSTSGFDLTWAANLLDRAPGEAAAAIEARRPRG